MLTLKFITENRDEVIRRLEKKHFPNAADVIAQVITLDIQRRATQRELDDMLAQMNQLSKSIGALMQSGKREEADEAKKAVANYKEQSKELSAKLEQLESDIRLQLLQIPDRKSTRLNSSHRPVSRMLSSA